MDQIISRIKSKKGSNVAKDKRSMIFELEAVLVGLFLIHLMIHFSTTAFLISTSIIQQSNSVILWSDTIHQSKLRWDSSSTSIGSCFWLSCLRINSSCPSGVGPFQCSLVCRGIYTLKIIHDSVLWSWTVILSWSPCDNLEKCWKSTCMVSYSIYHPKIWKFYLI